MPWACTSTLPLPLALSALLKVIPPSVVRSTMLPLPVPVVARPLWLCAVCAAAAPVLATRWAVSVTLPTVTSLLSSR